MKNQKKRENGTRDFVIANRVSGKVHGGLSRIRLSLTFRIALHYCVQMLRSFIAVALILTIMMCLFISYPVSRELRSMIPTDSVDTRTVIENGYLKAEPATIVPEHAFFPRLGQQFSVVFRYLFIREEIQFYYSSLNGSEWLVSLNMHDLWVFWLMMMCGVILCDLFRMLYFFRHDQRLNKRVLAPIRDIASMADTLSESNLSNRINIAGTKNELKDLAAVINRMLDRIERSYNSQKQFVSDASHELRTPISVIRGYTDMLKRWGKDDPEVLDEGITAISQETEGMKDLVESLLFLARHDKKTLMMEISTFDPAEIVNEVQKEETMVHADYRFDQSGIESMQIKADRNMMKQVLRILCDNAVKYSEPGSTVTLSCTKNTDGMCCLSVKDEGQGIPQEDLPKIFDRFYRSDKARKSETGGHGLGLSIARIIVIAHNGKIRVRSKPGCGTTFCVLLPAETE